MVSRYPVSPRLDAGGAAAALQQANLVTRSPRTVAKGPTGPGLRPEEVGDLITRTPSFRVKKEKEVAGVLAGRDPDPSATSPMTISLPSPDVSPASLSWQDTGNWRGALHLVSSSNKGAQKFMDVKFRIWVEYWNWEQGRISDVSKNKEESVLGIRYKNPLKNLGQESKSTIRVKNLSWYRFVSEIRWQLCISDGELSFNF